MAEVTSIFADDVAFADDTRATTSDRSYQAYRILQLGFVVAPILAGVDKFLHLMVDWDKYLPGFVNAAVGGHGHQLMLVVGVIEIVAGLGVSVKPRIFAYVARCRPDAGRTGISALES
jgi:hypothetical protein